MASLYLHFQKLMIRIAFFFALVLSQLVSGQTTGSIHGRITDVSLEGEPLLFANISLKDTPIVEQTNFHGNFEINNVEVGTYILQVSYLGYEPKEIKIRVKPNEMLIIEEALQSLTMQTENLSLTEVSTPLTKVAEKAEQQ